MAVSEDEREGSTKHMHVDMANSQRATRAEGWLEMTKRAFFLTHSCQRIGRYVLLFHSLHLCKRIKRIKFLIVSYSNHVHQVEIFSSSAGDQTQDCRYR